MTSTSNDNEFMARPRVRQPQATIDLLRERILIGKYAAGTKLPTQREMTEDLHVHRRVIRAAMTQLEKEGLLLLRRNSPPVVLEAPPPSPANKAHSPMANVVALVIHNGGRNNREGSGEQKIFWGLSQTLAGSSFHTVFLDLMPTEPMPDDALDAYHLQYVVDNGFGGVIFYSYSGDRNRDLIREVSRQIPLVLIDRIPVGIDADYVSMDNYKIMFDATNYLLGCGHRRIAYITSPPPVNTIQDRQDGYMTAISQYNFETLTEMIVVTPTCGTAWPVFDCLFRLPPEERPTAALCVNDYEAVRVAERLNYLGLTAPQDVSIIGCDNLIEKLPDGTALTTIEQPFVRIGEEAARLFLRRIEAPLSLPSSILLPAKLIVRDSVKSLI
jgi:DNA-binding LacI/PurR family transcriptional regulator